VRTIKKEPEPGVKRVNINIPIDLHNSFKSATASNGENMTDVLLKFIQDYVNDHAGKSSRKGKRG